ncbi:MAG TPA: hypothetical protein VHO25_14560 [Polyangiaceae bacterium]|nr:hypothetical protein [Polyangiaceae bacterium]
MRRLVIASCLVTLIGCGDDNPLVGGEVDVADDDAGTQDAGTPIEFRTSDHDEDGISDADEGRASNRDTDGDGAPDFRDLDSDGDAIPDSVEAGDRDDLSSALLDSDDDGTPDFRDRDADGDGIQDTDELDAQFRAVDSDDDGTWDHLDLDSDDDTISDAEEGQGFTIGLGGGGRGVQDSDGDDVPDFRDLDSDDDGLLDACEAGDSAVSSVAVQTDDDDAADYRDRDSDDDGVADEDEDENANCEVDDGESSPLIADSDDDGVIDLVERIAGTDPSDPAATIPPTDFYFVLPYMGPRGDGELDFSTTVRQADIFFSIDNTGSMEGETENIQDNLVSTIIPAISDVIPDAAFGLGRFRDFPMDPHGLTGDRPYALEQIVTTSSSEIGDAITALSVPGGGLDIPESGYEALFQWSTGAGIPSFGLPAFQSNPPEGIGGGGFRPDSLPILIHITDAISHDPADYSAFPDIAHDRDQTVDALTGIGARMIGINSLENAGNEFEPRSQLEDLAVATRATIPPDGDGMCPTGVDGALYSPVDVAGEQLCPVVFDVETDGSGLSTLIVDAIEQLATLSDLDVSTRAIGKIEGEAGEVLPDGTTTADFIKSITPVPPAPDGATIDGDIFRSVQPGSTVTFALDAHNDFVRHTDKDQLFTIRIQVLGDRVTVLDTRTVFVIVPREIPEPSDIR